MDFLGLMSAEYQRVSVSPQTMLACLQSFVQPICEKEKTNRVKRFASQRFRIQVFPEIYCTQTHQFVPLLFTSCRFRSLYIFRIMTGTFSFVFLLLINTYHSVATLVVLLFTFYFFAKSINNELDGNGRCSSKKGSSYKFSKRRLQDANTLARLGGSRSIYFNGFVF